MDRREFLKNTALVAAGAAVAATPMAAMMSNDKQRALDRRLKVLLVCGSARREGNTMIALQEVADQLNKHDIDVEILQIAPRPVRFCIACNQCKAKHLGQCVFDDDQCNEVIAKLREADALIVGSPVYYGQPNGGILALMQRVCYSASSIVQNKPAAGVAVCRRGGATAALQSLNMMFQMLNMPLVTSQYWNIVYGTDKGEARLDTEGMQTMRTLANNLAWMLSRIHQGGQPDYPKREDKWEGMNFIR